MIRWFVGMTVVILLCAVNWPRTGTLEVAMLAPETLAPGNEIEATDIEEQLPRESSEKDTRATVVRPPSDLPRVSKEEKARRRADFFSSSQEKIQDLERQLQEQLPLGDSTRLVSARVRLTLEHDPGESGPTLQAFTIRRVVVLPGPEGVAAGNDHLDAQRGRTIHVAHRADELEPEDRSFHRTLMLLVSRG